MNLFQSYLGPYVWFPAGSLLRGGVVNPTPNPQPGGTGPIFITPGTGWPSYNPWHWVPILIAFYNMHGLQWDYSLIPVTTRDNIGKLNQYTHLNSKKFSKLADQNKFNIFTLYKERHDAYLRKQDTCSDYCIQLTYTQLKGITMVAFICIRGRVTKTTVLAESYGFSTFIILHIFS